MIKTMVLWGLGINCDEETEAAYTIAGAKVTHVHVNELLSEKFSIHEFNIVHFPGGFSFGDHLGAGRVLANRIRFKRTQTGKFLRDEFIKFTENGGFIFGICNGFQILVALDLLPDNALGKVALAQNASGRFQDEWVHCRILPQSPMAKLWLDEKIYLPIRHGEGRLIAADEKTECALKEHNLIAMQYISSDGSSLNPNGSFESCAALCDRRGRILGMMPHPEAFLSAYNHPQWPSLKTHDKGQGLQFFENLIRYVGDSN